MNGSLTASFQSDAEAGLSGTPDRNAIETTLPQLFTLGVVSATGGSATFAFTFQSDLELAPVPEPSTLLLFGGMAGLGAVWRRSRRN